MRWKEFRFTENQKPMARSNVRTHPEIINTPSGVKSLIGRTPPDLALCVDPLDLDVLAPEAECIASC